MEKIHSVELPFQVGKTFFNLKSEEIDGFVQRKSKYGHTIAMVCLKPKMKSPPPQVASAVGTMVIPASVFAFLGGHESPLAAANRAAQESFDEQSYHVGDENFNSEERSMELDMPNNAVGSQSRLQEELAECKSTLKDERSFAIFYKNRAERLDKEVKQLQSTQEEQRANCNQHKLELDAERDQANKANMQLEKLQAELSLLKLQVDQNNNSNSMFSEQKTEADQ